MKYHTFAIAATGWSRSGGALQRGVGGSCNGAAKKRRRCNGR